MMIGDHQYVDGFVQRLWNGQFQVFAAICKDDAVVGQDVAWLVGRMPLIHVANDTLIQRLLRFGIQRRVGQRVLSLQRKVVRLLRRAQRCVIGDATQPVDGVFHHATPLIGVARPYISRKPPVFLRNPS